jgi:hypothetical protein
LTSDGIGEDCMCRNIKTLHNFRPPATEEEIRASSLQFVRKLSGFTRPSKANQIAFDRAVDEVGQGSTRAAQLSRDKRATPLSRSRGGKGAGKSGGPVPLVRRRTRQLSPNRKQVSVVTGLPPGTLLAPGSCRRNDTADLAFGEKAAHG